MSAKASGVKVPGVVDALQQLIAINSISSVLPEYDCSNLAVVERLSNWFSAAGFEVDILPVGEGKANMLATLTPSTFDATDHEGKASGLGGLVLSGHTDTVPCNPEKWQSDPFQLTERDNKFYGLGSCDMKGFFALILQAIQGIKAADLKHPLYILATADEESAMTGARALADMGAPNARYAVIGEPTGLKPIRMHKGIMMEVIRLTGKAGHSSNPNLGINAMDAMHEVMGELKNLRQDLANRYQNAHFAVQTPTLNLGCIHGGDNPNRICGHCELAFDLRALPGMSNDDLRAEIRQRLNPIAAENGVQFELESSFPGVAPFETPSHSPLVEAAERMTGFSSEAVAFATEAPFLQDLGMDTLVMGPGSIDQAHQVDEFLAHDQIKPGIQLLEQLIQRFCFKDSV